MGNLESQHEIIVPDKGFPFKLFQFEGKNGKYIREKHWHNSIEIFAVKDGDLDFFVNNEKMPIRTGEFIIVNTNEVHSIHAPKANETLVLQIPLKQFENYYLDELFINFEHNGKHCDKKIQSLIEQMFILVSEKKAGYELLTMSLYYQLLFFLVDVYRKENVDSQLMQSNKQLRKLSKVTAYLQEHYQDEISLEKLASVFGYAPEYLSRMFVKYAKINYKDYLQSVRLDHAKKDLEETQDQIGEIALRHGFASSKAFSNTFRKWYGVLPNDYRKMQE